MYVQEEGIFAAVLRCLEYLHGRFFYARDASPYFSAAYPFLSRAFLESTSMHCSTIAMPTTHLNTVQLNNHHSVDECYVPSDVLYQAARDRGLKDSKIIQYGLPVRRGFWDNVDSKSKKQPKQTLQEKRYIRESFRKDLGLEWWVVAMAWEVLWKFPKRSVRNSAMGPPLTQRVPPRPPK
jgi:hypothetical protein